MNSAEIAPYKLTVIKAIISDQETVSLLDPDNEFEYPDDMIYERIFPFERIPNTEQEVKTYVTLSVSIPSIGKANDLVRDVVVTVRVIAHTSLMKVAKRNGTRIDLLGARIDSLLNESYDFGIGPLVLLSNFEAVIDKNHFYRELKFQTLDLNSRRFGA